MMSLNLLKNSIHTLPHLFRFGLMGILVLFISLFFPSNTLFNYEFEQGKRWKYDDLAAPFDFPIKKSEGQLLAERELIAKDFTPYYRWNKDIQVQQKKKFVAGFSTQFQLISAQDSLSKKPDSAFYVNTALGIIDYLYKEQIIEVAALHQAKGDEFVFELLDASVDLGEHSLDDVLTAKEASQILVDTFTLSPTDPYSKLTFDLLKEVISVPNIYFDDLITEKNKQNTLNNLSPFRGMVKTGDLVVMRDQLIDSTTQAKLFSYEEKYNTEINEQKNGFLIYLGYLALTIALIAIFGIFMQFYSKPVYENVRHLSLILMMIAGYAYLSNVVDGIHLFNQYLIPFCIIPIVIQNFFSAQLALFTHIVIILLTSMLLSLDYQFILIQIIVGMVAIITKLKTRYLSDFFISLLYIGLAYTACFISLELIHTGAIFPIVSETGKVIVEGVRWEMLGWIGLNVFLTMLSYPLIPLLERMFGLTSEITLVEWADLNNPLLKELSMKAPGTLQHSLQVANLSEAAAEEVGANSLLVKVAALYHDIGKMENPEYFIENQNQHNPHEQLSYLESAKMILSHVTEGIKMAKKYRLPNVIVDFIRSHHGTTRVEYFYRKHKAENPDIEVDPMDFTYPGPRPQNKEEAIMMIADSLEAASKSLKNPSAEDIDNLVENIIKGKIAMHQFDDTNLSFQDLEKVKMVLKKLLKSINHVRIEYPGENKTAKPEKE
ncbi:MAG: HDIG domain-containing protein [Aureispira sp.]|nr:HDIG domain-containing protein [Aureispira sp.]